MKQVLINVLSALVLLGEEHMERLRKTVPTNALNYESVWKTYYGDYTGDGKDELIAFVCEHYGQLVGIYHLYYSTSKKVYVYDTLTLNKSFEAQILEDGSGSLLYFLYFGDGDDIKSCLYKCTNKGLSKINPPDEGGMFFYDPEYNYFSFYSLPMETSIPYFYYVEDGEFREFGGLEVTEDNLKKITALASGQSQNDVLVSINDLKDGLSEEGLKLINIIYRDLGRVKLLEVNCDATSVDQGFVCFRYFHDNSGECINHDAFYGNAKLANTPQIAVYPDIN